MKIKAYEDRVDGVDKPTDTSSNGLGVACDIERQDAMINDLIQLTRLQNTEINNLRQEVRHISASAAATAEKEDGLRAEMDELKRQVSALRSEQQKEKSPKEGENGGEVTPPKLTRKAHIAIRDPQTVKDKIIAAVKEDVTAQTLELEHKQGTSMLAVKSQIHALETIMSSVLSGIGCLYKAVLPPSDLRDEVSSIKHYYHHLGQKKADLIGKLDKNSDVPSHSKQQIILQYQFSVLSNALDHHISVAQKKVSHDLGKEQAHTDLVKEFLKLTKHAENQLQLIENHSQSIGSHGEEIGKIQNCLSSLQSVLGLFEKGKHESNGLKQRLRDLEEKVAYNFSAPLHSPAWSSSGRSTLCLPHDDSVDKTIQLSARIESQEQAIYEIGQKVISVETTAKKHKNSLFSDCRDLAILQKRLSYAEKLIGGAYSPDYFCIRGRSFYQDATSLRFTPTDRVARDTFSKFYGNRAEVARFVDIAPPVVMLAFHAIARVRCSHEVWENRLDLKQDIRRVAEDIIDSWMKGLPLREGEEHMPCHDRALIEDGNHLKLLCRRADMDFDGDQ